MPTWTIKGGARYAGNDKSWETSVDANGELNLNPVLTAGQTAVSWTYGSTSTGTAVMSAGHTILNAATVDLYWADGIRYGMTATVTDNSVALSGGGGDNCPPTGTAVILCTQVPITIAFDGDNLTSIVATATYRSLVCLIAGDASVKSFEVAPTYGLTWHEYMAKQEIPNPLASFTVVSGTISTTDPTSETTEKPVTLSVLFDSTPDYPG